MKKARQAWDDADFDVAPGLYETALDVGGLPRADVVDAYVHIGASLAITGKKKEGLAAFRNAALLDRYFKLPPEAGKKASALAAVARREQTASLAIAVRVPAEAGAGAAFGVDVDVTPARATLVDSLAFAARDTLAGREYERRAPAKEHVHFEVPTRLTLPGATLLVRVSARDANDNELATAESHVQVAAAEQPGAPAVAAAGPRDEHPAGRGFWHTQWPYLIGGVALAAAGGTAAWFATRPSPDVEVGSVHVELVH